MPDLRVGGAHPTLTLGGVIWQELPAWEALTIQPVSAAATPYKAV